MKDSRTITGDRREEGVFVWGAIYAGRKGLLAYEQ